MKILLSLFLLSISISAIGIELAGIFFSVSIFSYLIFVLFSLKTVSIKSIPLPGLFLLIFMFFCVVSNLFKQPLSSYIQPLCMLFFFSSLFLSNIYKRVDTASLGAALRYSYCAVVITVLLEVLFYLVYGLNPPIYSTLGIHGSSIEYYGMPRLRGFQLEPSILSYVAIFYFLAFNRISKIIDIPSFFTITPILLLVTTMAASGFIFLFYLGFSFLSSGMPLRYIIKNTFSSFIVVSIFLAIGAYFTQHILKILEKMLSIYDVIQNSNLGGSVGYRVNSLFEPFEFFANGDIFEKLTGTGFSNYSEYIYEKYKHLEYSGFASGDLNSILSAVAISTGLFGLVSFLLFIYFGFRDKSVSMLTDQGFIFVVFLMLSYGNLFAPFLWVMLFTLFILNKAR